MSRFGPPLRSRGFEAPDFIGAEIEAWTENYNTRAVPHSALDYQTPAAFAANLTARRAITKQLPGPRDGC